MNKAVHISFYLIFLLFILVGCRTSRKYPEKVFLTNTSLKIDNDTLDYYDLDDLIKQHENRRILWALRFHTNIYNMALSMKDRSDIRLKKWKKKVERKKNKDKEYIENLEKKKRIINGGFRNWLMYTVGEAPVYLDTVQTEKSVKQMQLYCKANGFFDAVVSDTIIYKTKKKSKCVLKYFIESGVSYRINELSYVSSDLGILRYIENKRSSTLLKKNSVYNEDVLNNERSRINDILKQEGYYHFSKAYIRYEIDTTIGNHLMNIKMIINRPFYSEKKEEKDSLIFYNHKRYKVNKIYVYPDFQINSKIEADYDTTVFVKTRAKSELVDSIIFVHRNELKIKPKIIVKKIFIKTNQLFNIGDARKTQNELSNLNNFKYINIRFALTPIEDYNQSLEKMDAIIELSRLPVNSTSFEIEGTNSAGNLGTAGNWVIKNRNLFHGAEIFDFSVTGGLELQNSMFSDDEENVINALPFNSLEFGTELRLTIPAFLLPINQNAFSQNSRPVTRFSSGFNYQLRPDYERYISHFMLSYQWRESKYRNMEFYLPINLIRINPDSMFAARIEQFSRTIRYSYEDHFIPGIGMQIHFNNQSNTRKKFYSFRKIRIEQSGLILWMGNGFNNAREGEIYRVLGINYAQYIKTDLDLRYYYRINNKNTLAFRSFFGIGLPYGNSAILPFEKSYSAGGSNEIRAWKYRSLGPGAYSDTLYYDKTGDISLVLNAEYRFPIISWFQGALFVDAGNVWLRYKSDDFLGGEFNKETFYKQIAVGAGFGLRLDFDFFIFRLDGGFPLVNPSKPDGEHWVGFDRFVRRTNFNFGIGYPF